MSIKVKAIALNIITLLWLFPVHGAPITAISQFNMSHSFVINSGNSPEGIEIQNLSSTLSYQSEAISFVDDPNFTNNNASDFQVGNPFTEPPLPVLSSGTNTTINLANGDFASANYDYSITAEDDPDANNFDLTRRSTVQSGFAEAFIANDPVDASASSSSDSSRNFQFDNVTGRRISFNISGLFEAEMFSSFEGTNGFAHTSAGFEMLFDIGLGSAVTYFPVAPYLFNIQESGPNAMVSEIFSANSEGVSFSGSALAVGNGSQTVAELFSQSRYVFTVTLDAGASLLMRISFNQSNMIESAPKTTSVTEPAHALLFLFSLFGLICLRHKH